MGVRLRRALADRIVGHGGVQLATVQRASDHSGRAFSLVPGFASGISVQLLPRVLSKIEWRWNLDPGLSTDISWSSADDQYAARLSGSISPSGRLGFGLRMEKTVSWAWLNPLYGFSTTARTSEDTAQSAPEWAKGEEDDDQLQHHSRSGKGCIFSSFDVNTADVLGVTIGAQCSVSVFSRLQGSISVSLQRGVLLKIGLQRGSQSFSFPITLSEYPDTVAAGYGLLVPLLTFAAVRTLVYEPYLLKQFKQTERIRRKELKGELTRQRREALATQTLMRNSANRIRQAESEIGGLVIVRAVYGLIPGNADHTTTDPGGPTCIDVTVPLQSLVDSSRIRLPPGRWADLQGFYDPTVGLVRIGSGGGGGSTAIPRELHVVYRFRGDPHEVTVRESLGLAIPMSKHRLDADSS